METLKIQACKLQWFRHVQRMANSSNGNINIGYKMPGKSENKVDKLCHRGHRAMRKWCMTGCGICQRQETMDKLNPPSATYRFSLFSNLHLLVSLLKLNVITLSLRRKTSKCS